MLAHIGFQMLLQRAGEGELIDIFCIFIHCRLGVVTGEIWASVVPQTGRASMAFEVMQDGLNIANANTNAADAVVKQDRQQQ